MTEPTQEALAVLAMAFAAHAEAWHEIGEPDDYSLETDFQRISAARTAAALIIQDALDKRAAETEARIVAWLRAHIADVDGDNRYWGGPHRREYLSARELADAIERGEHKEPKQ